MTPAPLVLSAAIASALGIPTTALGADTTVLAGNTMVVNDQTDLGAVNTTTEVQDGGTLEITGGTTLQQDLYTIAGDGVVGVGAINNSSGNNTLSGDIELGDTTTITSSAGRLTLNGDISSPGNPPGLDFYMGGDGDILYTGNLTLGAVGQSESWNKTGNGTLTLTGANNSFTGYVAFAGGTVAVSGGGQLTIDASNSLDLTTIDANLIVTGAGSTFTNTGYLVVGWDAPGPASVTVDNGGHLYANRGQIGGGDQRYDINQHHRHGGWGRFGVGDGSRRRHGGSRGGRYGLADHLKWRPHDVN